MYLLLVIFVTNRQIRNFKFIFWNNTVRIRNTKRCTCLKVCIERTWSTWKAYSKMTCNDIAVINFKLPTTAAQWDPEKLERPFFCLFVCLLFLPIPVCVWIWMQFKTTKHKPASSCHQRQPQSEHPITPQGLVNVVVEARSSAPPVSLPAHDHHDPFDRGPYPLLTATAGVRLLSHM